jgi:hypothetical protein
MYPFEKGTVSTVQTNQPVFSQSQVVPDYVPKVESFSIDKQKPQVRYITKIRYIDVPRYIDKEPVQNSQETTGSITSNDKPNSMDLSSANLGISLSPGFNMSNTTNNFTDLGIGNSSGRFSNLILPEEQIGLSLEVRGSQYWNFEKEYISPFKSAMFNNTSLSLYYNLLDNFAIGGEVRQENFYQKYNSPAGDTIFQQQPNFTTFGVNFRYTIPYDFWGIEPMIQLNVGANNAGITGRIMPGLKYTPYRDLTFIIGGELSGLRFHHKNEPFYSYKFGLNYGVMVNF